MAQTQGNLVIDDDYVLGRGKAFSDRGNDLEENDHYCHSRHSSGQ
ncbi:hypothetical protein PT279_03765 [Bifidobacterium sp. ESL0784]|nr:hypothetical protein [Bifidobacterium sp. ESL0784]MDF7640708.1 hypothetical protein [Bifidobacterium sp. ESL0784]